MLDGLTALITGGFTLAAGLGGAHLSGRQERLRRREEARRQKDVIQAQAVAAFFNDLREHQITWQEAARPALGHRPNDEYHEQAALLSLRVNQAWEQMRIQLVDEQLCSLADMIPEFHRTYTVMELVGWADPANPSGLSSSEHSDPVTELFTRLRLRAAQLLTGEDQPAGLFTKGSLSF